MEDPNLVEFSVASGKKRSLTLSTEAGQVKIDSIAAAITDAVSQVENVVEIEDLPPEFQLAAGYLRASRGEEPDVALACAVFEGMLLAAIIDGSNINLTAETTKICPSDFQICMDRAELALSKQANKINDMFRLKIEETRKGLEIIAKGFGIEDLSSYDRCDRGERSEGSPEGDPEEG